MFSYLIHCSFTTSSGSNQHNSMAYNHGFIQLDDLFDLGHNHLQFIFLLHRNDLCLQATIVMLRNIHSRKQILQNSLQDTVKCHKPLWTYCQTKFSTKMHFSICHLPNENNNKHRICIAQTHSKGTYSYHLRTRMRQKNKK